MLVGPGIREFGRFEPGDVGVDGVVRGVEFSAGGCGGPVDVGLLGGVDDGGGEGFKVNHLGFFCHDG